MKGDTFDFYLYRLPLEEESAEEEEAPVVSVTGTVSGMEVLEDYEKRAICTSSGDDCVSCESNMDCQGVTQCVPTYDGFLTPYGAIGWPAI